MNLNVGKIDRIIRAIVGTVLVYWLVTSSPLLGSMVITIIIAIFAAINVLSSLFGWCITYSLFGLSTKK